MGGERDRRERERMGDRRGEGEWAEEGGGRGGEGRR